MSYLLRPTVAGQNYVAKDNVTHGGKGTPDQTTGVGSTPGSTSAMGTGGGLPLGSLISGAAWAAGKLFGGGGQSNAGMFGSGGSAAQGGQTISTGLGSTTTIPYRGGAPSGQPSNDPTSYMDAVNKQFQYGKDIAQDTTNANRPGITTPYGEQQWHKGPDGHWYMSTGFGGGLGDANNNLQNQWAQNTAQPFDNGTATRDAVTKATYDQMASRLNPQWGQRASQMQTSLANQGLDSQGAAYGNEMGAFDRNRNDAYTSALRDSIANGNAAQSMTFNQNMATRDMPLEEMSHMQGLLNMPGFNASMPYAPPNYFAAYGAQNQANADQMKGTAEAVKAAGDLWTAYNNSK